MKLHILCMLVVFGHISATMAEVIEFPDEDLATETVLPVFENKAAVRNRIIDLNKKVEAGFLLGATLNEAFYKSEVFGINLGYHFNDLHGLAFHYFTWSGELSSYGGQLKNAPASVIDSPIDFSKAPSAESMYMLNWEYNAFYGKISLSKQTVYNLHVYSMLGLGQIKFGDQSNLVVNAGIGQRVYFSKNWALRMDFNLLFYNALDPSSLGALDPSGPSYSASDFSTKNYFNQSLTFGLVGIL
ncbi:MAG: outer membrane beta-barrel domain-containing protein [Bdellovibrionales bacterium]